MALPPTLAVTAPSQRRRQHAPITGALAVALFALAGCSRSGNDASGPQIPSTAGENAASAVAPEAMPSTPLPPNSAIAVVPGASEAATSGPAGASATGVTGTAGSSAPVADADTEFLRKAASNGHFELGAAQLAAQKATNAGVKAYAQMLVKDHTTTAAELAALAQARKVALPTAADDAHRTALEGLRSKQGADFDRAFLENVGEHQHQVDLQLFTIESASGRDAEVKQWAGKVTAVLNRHLVEAQRLAGKSAR